MHTPKVTRIQVGNHTNLENGSVHYPHYPNYTVKSPPNLDIAQAQSQNQTNLKISKAQNLKISKSQILKITKSQYLKSQNL